ncbi:hypothetical protein AAHA92_04109 [Salvia divinorum]|uniref:RING-CH-type domain-containing protein n=1 Tax=Salvia divinorum TaxID=28513 RepID=A0ABD1I257_SALDI
MVDELMVVCVDRIIASAACLQPPPPPPPPPPNKTLTADGGGTEESSVAAADESDNAAKDAIFGGGISSSSSTLLLSECRICQEEDDGKGLESPCSCSGTLKFAHRKCVQRWCNKKGDTTCEICNQVFSPNYTCPLPRGNADVITIDIRQALEAHVDLQRTRLLAFTEAERHLLESGHNDYGTESQRILIYFRSAVIILMLLLLIHQTFVLDVGAPLGSSVFLHYLIFVAQLSGFLLPCYVVGYSWYILRCRRRRQG